MAAKRKTPPSPRQPRARKPKEYPVPEQNRVLMQELLAGLDRAQAWKLANPDKPFSDYLEGK